MIDTVGEATWEHSLKSVRPGGTVVVAGATAGATVRTDLFRLFLQHITVQGSAMGRIEELRDLVALCDARGVTPHIDSVVDLDRTPEAFVKLAAGAEFGKVAVP